MSRVPASSLDVTTPSMTVSSELTTPGGASLVDDNEEEGLVLDQATLVLGMRTPTKKMSWKRR